MVTLGALKGVSTALQEMRINEIQVHILDEGGDGIVLCLEYEEFTGELNKTFSCVNEFYTDEHTVEVELIEDEACNSPENRAEIEMDKETDFLEDLFFFKGMQPEQNPLFQLE